MTNTNRDIKIKQLTYRSWHRGCKETDVILGHFADSQLASLSDEDINIFEQLLEEFDADIWKWLVQKETPSNPIYTKVLDKLRSYSQTHEDLKCDPA